MGAERTTLKDTMTATYVTAREADPKTKVPKSGMDGVLKVLLRSNRDLVAPQYTTEGKVQGEIGDATSSSQERKKKSNAIHNPINNPTNHPKTTAKRKAELQEEFAVRQHTFEDDLYLGFANAVTKAFEITQENEFFTFGIASTYSFYIFYTKRDLDDEFWGFLTNRRGYNIGKDGEKIPDQDQGILS